MRYVNCTPSPARTAPGDSERGAVAVIVALLVVALFGLGALVIDVGMVYQEKSELQSAADAAAIALAYDCLTKDTTTACTTNSTTQGQAQFFVDANSTDDTTDVLDIVWGKDGDDVPTVTVSVGTRSDDGGDEIDFVLAPVLGTDSTTVYAQATARWGVPSDLEPSPFAVGLCDWENATNKGDDYGLTVEPRITLRVEASVPLHCVEEDLTGLLGEVGGLLCPPACVLPPELSDDALGGFSYLRSNGNCDPVIIDGYAEQEIGVNDGLDLLATLDTLGCVLEDLLFSDYLIVPIFDVVNDGNDPPGACPTAQTLGLPYCYRIYGYSAFRMADFDSDVLGDVLGVDFDLLMSTLGVDLGGLSVILNILGIGGVTGVVPFLDGNFDKVVLQDYNGAIDPNANDLGLTTVQLTG